MICEDEQDLLTIYSTAFKSRYNVLAVNSGRACIEKYMDQKLRGKRIDLLLLDYRLGDMLGDDVACKISELDGTKTILISAYELDNEVINNLKQRSCIVEMIKKTCKYPITGRNSRRDCARKMLASPN